jgi:tetratricopeptide (TPR) repeat protein
VTQEFHLSVTPVGGDEYLVRTERVSPGVPLAEEQVSWSVDSWLAQARQLMNDPLLGLLRGESVPSLNVGHLLSPNKVQNGSDPQVAANLVSLGQQLYNALFQGTVRDSWMTAKGIAQHRREFLRLRLGLKGDRLPCLPWEVLHAGDRPLATGTDVVFSRYHSTFTPASLSLKSRSLTILEPNQPLKILMVVAAPTDQEILELKQEASHLQQELQQTLLKNGSADRQLPEEYDPELQWIRRGGFPEIQLTILDQPGREKLTQAMEQGEYHVLHYAGHSNLGASGGSIYLVNERTGLTEELSGDDLAGLLVNNGIQMAVFNSCRGVYTSTADVADPAGTGNLAEALIKRGIPAVMAMAERIPDEVALTLSRLFYRNLKQVYPVDLSLNRARQGLISAYGSQQPYWALPILYLHPEFDGYLQSLTTETAEQPPEELISYPTLQNQGFELPSNVASRSSQSQLLLPIDNLDDLSELDADLDPDLIAIDALYNDDLEEESPEDLAKLVEDIEHDASYEDDANVVSDLIRQLSLPETQEEPTLPASAAENLLPTDETDSRLKRYRALSESFLYGGAAPAQNDRATSNHAAIPMTALSEGNRKAQRYAELEQIPDQQHELAHLIADCQQAILVNPQDAMAYYNLGLALHHQGNLPEAIAAYNRAIQLNPKLAETESDLKTALRHQREDAPHASSTQATSGATTSRNSVTTLSERKSEAPSQKRLHSQRPLQRVWLPIAGLIGAGALVLLGVAFFQNRLPIKWQPNNSSTLPVFPLPRSEASAQLTSTLSSNVNLNKAETASVTAIAINKFNQGDLVAAELAVAALLDRGALPQAKAALDEVPGNQNDNATISFLKGRLAWQSVKVGNLDYSNDDARRFWETAVRQQKDNVLYLNALGFAYYAEGELNRAYKSWFDALYLAQEKQANSQPVAASVSQQPTPTNLKKETLTAYAGMALVLVKSAKSQPAKERTSLLSEAIKLQQKVLTDDPVNFQPNALSSEWMWNEVAIQDWRSLLQQKDA